MNNSNRKKRVRGGRQKASWATKNFTAEELKTVLDEDPCQIQEEFAKSVRADQTTIFKRLNTMTMIQM